MGCYAVKATRTLSTTLPVSTVTANATRPRRGELYELNFGAAEATPPGDTGLLWEVSRCTTTGTGTTVTPQPLDPNDAATEMGALQALTVAPTITAGSQVLSIGLNQRASFRWLSHPDRAILYPATGGNGLVITTPTSTAITGTAVQYILER